MSASTALITDIGTVISNGPSATTATNAASGLSNASYPSAGITDYAGGMTLVKLKLQEAKELLTMLKNITDSGDGSLTTINNVLSSLS